MLTELSTSDVPWSPSACLWHVLLCFTCLSCFI